MLNEREREELRRMAAQAVRIDPRRKEPDPSKLPPLYKRIQLQCKILAGRFFILDKNKIEPGKIFKNVTGEQYKMMKDGSIHRAVPKSRRHKGNDLQRYKRLGIKEGK